jgi:hypothetical protein
LLVWWKLANVHVTRNRLTVRMRMTGNCAETIRRRQLQLNVGSLAVMMKEWKSGSKKKGEGGAIESSKTNTRSVQDQ